MQRLILFLFTVLLLAAAPAMAGGMKPGMWEITSTLQMPGMPFQPPPQTIRHCYTAEEVTQAPVPAADPSCKVSNISTSGGTTRWSVVCKGEVNGSGKGEMTYQGDSAYSGKMTMTTEGMTMTTTYRGKRIGDCR